MQTILTSALGSDKHTVLKELHWNVVERLPEPRPATNDTSTTHVTSMRAHSAKTSISLPFSNGQRQSYYIPLYCFVRIKAARLRAPPRTVLLTLRVRSDSTLDPGQSTGVQMTDNPFERQPCHGTSS
jgi:hypothetical protein